MVEEVVSFCAVHYKSLKFLFVPCVNDKAIAGKVLVWVAGLIKVNLCELEGNDALGQYNLGEVDMVLLTILNPLAEGKVCRTISIVNANTSYHFFVDFLF